MSVSHIRSQSDPQARLEAFIEGVSRDGVVWGLKSAAGWAVVSADDDQDCFPAWPNAEAARAWAVADLADCQPAAIDLDGWLEKWLPGMDGDGTLVLVNPSDDDDEEGLVLPPGEIEQLLLEALGR
jgi:hypothetical protein